MIPRIISARPFISLATLLAVVVCLFYIYSKEMQIQADKVQVALFKEQGSLPTLYELPFPISYAKENSQELLFRRVSLEGIFLPDHEVYLENRVSEDSPKNNNKKTNGFHIMMPFQLQNGSIVWVNRGWIARDPANRRNIPQIPLPTDLKKIDGYITISKKDIFEMPSEAPHMINGHVVALNFYLHDDKKELPNRNVYPFLITQTGGDHYDGLIRPETGYYYMPDYSFDLRAWWITLIIAIGFWLINGFVQMRRKN